MEQTISYSWGNVARDLVAGSIVFLVALPLCLGVALASNAPLFAGILAGIVGGMLVGFLSGSHTSVSGPAAGLTAIVAAQIGTLGTFDTFLLAVVFGGIIQIGLGLARAGFIAAFFPTSVIKGLLAAIGVIVVLKQIPHVFGHDTSPEGEMAFQQVDHENTFSELGHILSELHLGAALIGILSVAFLFVWDRVKPLKKSIVPAPLMVVVFGVLAAQLFRWWGGHWEIATSHLVQVPVSARLADFFGFLRMPDFSQRTNPAVYSAGLMIAIVSSLETLLNLEAIDKLDPRQRVSPPSRELLAQGVGNVAVGLIGGIPVTSVIVRSSVNINAGSRSKLATIFHGALLLICVVFLSQYLNMIPLSCLGAILLVTGIKLASPSLFRQMWSEGRYQFVPFVVTLVAIVLTDLVTGILIGLAISLGFILNSNFRRPMRRIVERHLGGEVVHIELANQVSFLNRAALEKNLRDVPAGAHLLLDARHTDYIDPDVLDVIRDFKETTAPALGIQFSLQGFRPKYGLQDEIQYVDYSTRELQERATPQQVLQILREGNERFRTGRRLTRDLGRQVQATANSQHPLAVVFSCIDSRTPAELIFDLGLGDIFSVRVAGNVISPKVLGSIEYGCAVAGGKLILVMGHTRCGAVNAAVKFHTASVSAEEATGCQHLDSIVQEIQNSIDKTSRPPNHDTSDAQRTAIADEVARRNVQRCVQRILEESATVSRLVAEGRVAIVGAMYDVSTGQIDFLTDDVIASQAAGAPA